MNTTTENHLENAFKELEAFSISGIGTFRKHKGLHDEIEVEVDPEVDESLLLETWLIDEKGLDVSAATTIERWLKMKIQWDLKTKSQYEISGVGVLHQHFTGKLSFYPYKDSDEESPIPLPESQPVPAPQPAKKKTPWIAYTLVGIFFMVGCFIIYKGIQSTQASNGIVLSEIDGVSDTAVVSKSVMPVSEVVETEDEPKEVTQQPSVAPKAAASPSLDPVDLASRNQDETPSTVTLATQSIAEELTTQVVGDLSLLDTVKTTKTPSLAPTPTTSTARIAQPASQTAFQWHLILGSYVTETAAKKAFASLTSQGHTPTLITPKKGVDQPYRVSIFNSEERGKVESFQSTYQRSTGSATWLLQVRE